MINPFAKVFELTDAINRLNHERQEELERLLPTLARFKVGDTIIRPSDKAMARVVGRFISHRDGHMNGILIEYEIRKITKTGLLHSRVEKLGLHREAEEWAKIGAYHQQNLQSAQHKAAENQSASATGAGGKKAQVF